MAVKRQLSVLVPNLLEAGEGCTYSATGWNELNAVWSELEEVLASRLSNR